MTSEQKVRYLLLRDSPHLVQQLEDEAICILLERYTPHEVEKMRINIQALVAPIIRY